MAHSVSSSAHTPPTAPRSNSTAPSPRLGEGVPHLATSSIAPAFPRSPGVCRSAQQCPSDPSVDRYVDSVPYEDNTILVKLNKTNYRLNSSPISWKRRPLGESTCAPVAPLGCILLMQHLAESAASVSVVLRLTDPSRLRANGIRKYYEMSPYLPMHMEVLENYLELNPHKRSHYNWNAETGELIMRRGDDTAYLAKEVNSTLSDEAKVAAGSIGLVFHEVMFQMKQPDNSWGKECRLIELYVSGWKDGKTMNVPQLLAVLLWMERYMPDINPVVHCSAGVRRTGVVMGCRALLAGLRFKQFIPTSREIRDSLLSQRPFDFQEEEKSMLQCAIDLAIACRSSEELEKQVTLLANQYRCAFQQEGEIFLH